MKEITPEERRRYKATADLVQHGGELAILTKLIECEDRIEEAEEVISEKVSEVNKAIEFIEKGKDGYTPIKGVDYVDGRDGKDAIITPEVIKEIAKKVEIPVVEKVIERTEVIKEVPIVTNEIVKEIVKDNTGIVEQVKEELVSVIDKLKDELKELKKDLATKSAGGGVRRVFQPYIDDFSSQTNGVTKTFYLSREPLKTSTILVWGTDFPIILRPTTDFTVTGKTFTLTSAVPAPSQGATLLIQFYA